jgi:hypothetical protein
MNSRPTELLGYRGHVLDRSKAFARTGQCGLRGVRQTHRRHPVDLGQVVLAWELESP